MEQQPANDDTEPLEDILEEARESSDGEKTSVGELVDAFGAQSLGPVLILFGLLALFPPIGAVPGVPILLGAALVLYSVQFIAGATRIWLPKRLREVSFEREKIENAKTKMQPWLRRIDRLFTERLTVLVGPTSARLVGVAALLHALLMIPLEFISAVALPGAALTFSGVALTARDGLMMLVGWAITAAAVYVSIAFVPWDEVAGLFS
ncbi:exopolysaccharide biosynthesis protein [Parvularcula lutaonensis]|uniref:Exopolysaccharide biosynthesis protein n=1 Tax=Parvularcula lutaonensis TaxID=491923 RepID=A0ABV7M8B7_9PROT|nr:exopolysaccharide biosynthesis protein [Parvularcula lutaonensis]GGY44324.1 hypothetical protein GCM10007148_11520 [Parvularcula lutaonensis]